jgi:hypothetical protein
VVGRIEGTGVFVIAGFNDVQITNTTIPLLGAGQSLGDLLNETDLTPVSKERQGQSQGC